MFFDDIIKLIYSEPKRYYRYYSSPYWEGYLVSENLKRINRRKRRQHRKLHKTYAIKGTMPKIKQAKTIDNMFKNDEEYKEYHFTPIEDKIEKYPVYWDDTYRIIQSN